MEKEAPNLIDLEDAGKMIGTKYAYRAAAFLRRHNVELVKLNKWELGVDKAKVQALVDAGIVIKRGRPPKGQATA